MSATTKYKFDCFVYCNGALRYHFADGYTDGTTNGYHYYIRDHQGNNRVVAKYDGTIEQTTHYYPYGGILSQSTNQGVQKFKYNGKEFDTMHGLNMYDYGARQQDPAVGMFTSMDPLCEKYYNVNPYMYCHANPIMRIDPDGKTDYYQMGGKLYKTIEDGCSDKRLILSTNKKSYDNAISNNQTILVPSNDVVESMEQCYLQTERTGNETGFIVSNKNAVSQIIEGGPTNINSTIWQKALKDIKTEVGESAQWSVHAHPNDVDSKKVGAPEPSLVDKLHIIGNGAQPSAILGYKQDFNIDKTKTTGSITLVSSQPTFTQMIGFYNANGIIGEPLDFKKFSNTVRKINKQ